MCVDWRELDDRSDGGRDEWGRSEGGMDGGREREKGNE